VGDEQGHVYMIKITNIVRNGEILEKQKKFNNTTLKLEEKFRVEAVSNDLYLSKISKIMERNR
jgi:hypothetical protein